MNTTNAEEKGVISQIENAFLATGIQMRRCIEIAR